MPSNENDEKDNLRWFVEERETTKRRSAGEPVRKKIIPPPPRQTDLLIEADKSLKDYLDLVIERKWVVVIIFLVCTVAAVAYALTQPRVYTSSALIEIEEKRAKANQMIGSQEYVEIQRYLLTQMEVLRSRSLAEALVEKLSLTESPEFKPGAVSPFAKIVGLFTSLFHNDETAVSDPGAARENAVVRAVMGRVKASPVRNSNIIRVSMEAGNPVAAQQMLQEYLALYLKRNLDNRRQESIEGAEWLKVEVEKSEKRLREAQSALVSFVVDHGIVDSADGGLGQVLNIVNRTMEVHLKSREEREKLQALKSRQSSELSVLSGEMKNELIDKLKGELATLESEYSQMKGVYSANYPKMRMNAKRMEFLRSRIAELERRMVSTALDTAKTREEIFKETYEQAKAEADRVKSLEAQYSLLKGSVDTTGEFLKILLREYKETEIKARTISNNARIVDQPSRPLGPSRPKRKLIVLLGALLGLGGGVLAAFVRDVLDQSVRRPEDATLFQTRSLGVVPDIDKLKSIESRARGNAPIELIASKHPQSPVSDAVKNIQASIFLSALDDDVTSLAVSSATPGEGKSLLSVSLASVLAGASKKRVVLVDADMRRPRIHSVFSLPPRAPGLTDFLGSSKMRLAKVIHRTSVEGLYVISSGTQTADPVALLQADDMRILIDQLKAHFDYVVVDTPPILGFADTPLICRHVDGAVLVVKQGGVRKDEVALAVDALGSVGTAKIFGMILNKAHVGTAGKYGYGYGRYYYRNYHYYHRRSS